MYNGGSILTNMATHKLENNFFAGLLAIRYADNSYETNYIELDINNMRAVKTSKGTTFTMENRTLFLKTNNTNVVQVLLLKIV